MIASRIALAAMRLLVALAGAAPAAWAAADVVVAIPAPLSGPRAGVGMSMHTAAGIVASELNASGGIAGASIAISLHDDPCDSSSPALAQEIAAGPAVAVIGHPCAASAHVAHHIYRKAGKLFIAAGARSSRPGVGAFRIPAHEAMADALAKLLVARAAERAASLVAIVRDKTQLNTSLAVACERALRAAGIAVSTEVFVGGDKDFKELARRLAARQVTLVGLMAFTIEGALIAGEIATALPAVEIVGPDQVATADFAALAGAAAAARVEVLLPVTDALYEQAWPAAKALATRLRAVGVPVHREAIEMAAALQAWAGAARAAGSWHPASVGVALQQPQATLLGDFAFDAAGNAQVPGWAVHRWRDGAFRALP